MPRLSDASQANAPLQERFLKRWTRWSRSIMRSQTIAMPKSLPELPLRIRPWFLVFTSVIMVFLALLGFTDIAKKFPLNEKILHFLCLGVATGVFYFIIDVNEDARRIWFWRWSGVIVTAVTCCFFGGIISEVVQSLLPNNTFEFGEVLANLAGSLLGLYIAFYLEKHYRARREISRLYQPLQGDYELSDDEDETAPGQPYPSSLPLPVSANHGKGTQPKPTSNIHSQSRDGDTRLGNVWDERMFDIGDEEDDSPI